MKKSVIIIAVVLVVVVALVYYMTQTQSGVSQRIVWKYGAGKTPEQKAVLRGKISGKTLEELKSILSTGQFWGS